ncbi:MAG: hypothetical protein FJX67_13670 [Alphaproteobacteria bacterium]|nr:hypothetical protein [Alphaproteobacteria bacterium]
MKPVAFGYARAETVEEAIDLLAEEGREASVIAGGLSLGAMLNMRLVRPRIVLDINRVPGLDTIVAANGVVTTGALVRQVDAFRDPTIASHVPLLAHALPHVGHYQTRSRGTLGGSVAHADPSAEIPLALVTLGGAVVLRAKGRTRRVPAADFFLGVLTTAREENELLVALEWPTRRPRTVYAFDEIAQRHGDFAIAAVAVAAEVVPDGTLGHLALGLGGIEDRPIRIETAGYAGRRADASLAEAIAEDAASRVVPIVDLQANADYRRQLVRVLGRRVLAAAFEDAVRGA